MSQPVIIIGAGPGGCAAAIQLLKAGIEVTLLEAEIFPRHRPGESLHPGVEPILKSLGIFKEVEAAKFHRHPGCLNAWNGDARFESFGSDSQGQWFGYQAWRSEFDAILLNEAIRCGATVQQQCRVRKIRTSDGSSRLIVESSSGQWEADWVLDGTGAQAIVARSLGIGTTRHSGPLTAHYGYVDHSELNTNFEIPLLRRDDSKWTWIAQVTPSCCAWVTVHFSTRARGECPPELKNCPAVRATRGCDVTWRIRDHLAAPGWMLLGDAAAVLDPASSHGVLRALMSGMQAAHLLKRVRDMPISQHTIANHYDQWLREWFLNDIARLKELYEGRVVTALQ